MGIRASGVEMVATQLLGAVLWRVQVLGDRMDIGRKGVMVPPLLGWVELLIHRSSNKTEVVLEMGLLVNTGTLHNGEVLVGEVEC